jgi:citrate lyase subunit beta / citryl-CoA lyase
VTPRSNLFVPGHRSELIAKALAGKADAIIIDLEDAVPAELKEQARHHTAAALRTADPHRQAAIWVRINAVRSPQAEADLTAIAQITVGIRVPKTESPDDLDWVAGRAPKRPVLPTTETARGVAAAHIIAAHPAVVRLGLGGMDLVADLGCHDDPLALLYSRSRLVAASRAAGLPGPINSIYPHPHDEPGLRSHAQHAAALGFTAQSLISPRQIDAVNDIFTPSSGRQAWARTVLESFDAAGGQPTLTPTGEFVDLPVARRAAALITRGSDDATA